MNSSARAMLHTADATVLVPAPQGMRVERIALQILNWVRRYGSELMKRPSSRRLRMVETVSLGEKRFISIVQVDSEQFLVGGSASALTVLAKLEGLPLEQQESSPHSFVDLYARAQERQSDEFSRREGSVA